jgi:hypothetical protein
MYVQSQVTNGHTDLHQMRMHSLQNAEETLGRSEIEKYALVSKSGEGVFWILKTKARKQNITKTKVACFDKKITGTKHPAFES